MTRTFASLCFSGSLVVFGLLFLMTALNFVAVVFYGRVDVRERFGYLDIFTIDAKALNGVGVRARRSVVTGLAGMGAVGLLALVAGLFVFDR